MKSFLIALTLFASLCSTPSHASDGIVSPEVLKSFQSKFTTAKNADWSVAQDLYKVQFELDGQNITAFYRADGSMAALTRNISPSQLPVNLKLELTNEYSAYWIAGLFELSNEDGVRYYVTLENADTQTILKSSDATWMHYLKNRK